jgi:hypothetical protein
MIATLKGMLAQKTGLTKLGLHAVNAGATLLSVGPFMPANLHQWQTPLIYAGAAVTTAGTLGLLFSYRQARAALTRLNV